jgi:hypothetical protein
MTIHSAFAQFKPIVSVLDAMYLQRMCHHLVFERERSIPRVLTAIATIHWAPKHRSLYRVRTIVVSVEIVPTTERPPAASRDCAAEDEDAWVVGWLDSADVLRR